MTSLREAAQQALEALEEATSYTSCTTWSPSMTEECEAAAAALRAALAEPVQEPEGMVEFLADLQRSRTKYPKNARMFDGLMGEVDELRRAYAGDGDIRAEAFDVAVCAFRIATEGDAGGNTLLEPARPVQEPVAWLSRDDARLALWEAINKREFGNPTDDKLILDHLHQQGLWIGKYTAPPQRKPLTEEEIDNIWVSEKAFADIYAIARAIERAHGIGGSND